jgi:hypothetical protein
MSGGVMSSMSRILESPGQKCVVQSAKSRQQPRTGCVGCIPPSRCAAAVVSIVVVVAVAVVSIAIGL